MLLLTIKGISYSQTQTGSYALILEEHLGIRKLAIIIGSHEAQSIALALESDLITKRPVTHDLFTSLSRCYHINLKFVSIYKIEEGIFYSNLYFEDVNGIENIIDARTSDAISLAVRFNAPIYTTNEVLEKAGIIIEMNDSKHNSSQSTLDELEQRLEEELTKLNIFSEFSKEELNEKLQEALENEDYESAALIRDELELRTKNGY